MARPDLVLRRFEARSDFDLALADRLESALTLSRAADEPTSQVESAHARESQPSKTNSGNRSTSPGTGDCFVMLSGGNTPLPAYRWVGARAPRVAPGLTILYSDERYVPATAQESNYKQSRVLIDALNLPESRIRRVRTELPLEEAASDYEAQLATILQRASTTHATASDQTDASSPTLRGFALLGMGADGHTASLFSDDDLQRARDRLAIAVQRPDGMAGISVTPKFFARMSDVLLAISGPDKSNALERLLAKDDALITYRALAHCRRVDVWACTSG